MKAQKSFYLFLFLAILKPSALLASDLIDWTSNNIQILRGSGFELANDTQTTVTFEHANSWLYGDNFFYVDYSLGEPDEINAEFSPRLSLSKITGLDLQYGLLQDVLLSGTWEKARRFDAFLVGGALDWTLPGFSYFQTNFYWRDNPDADGHGWQTTFVWSRPFTIENAKFSFDGYFDYADYEEGTRNFFTQPQLLFDIGDATGAVEEGSVFLGLEYRYWHNKYGIDGVTEHVPQVMVKMNF